jgi:hypothetical protein
MHWWQWVLQITGAWFYLGLLVAGLWSIIGWHRRRARAKVWALSRR